MTTLEQIKEKIAEINKQKEELTAELRQNFAPMLMPLFEKSNGTIESIGWTQYTPYFNDGDECVFSVNFNISWGLKINGESIDEHEDMFSNSMWGIRKLSESKEKYQEWIEKYPNDKVDTETIEKDLKLYSLIKEFHDLLTSIDEEFYKDLFGDHVEVTINADGTVDTTEYNHD